MRKLAAQWAHDLAETEFEKVNKVVAELEQMVEWVGSPAPRAEAQHTIGTLVTQTLERPLRADENTLDEPERALRVETPAEADDRLAEMILPEPIDEHARGEWIFRTGDPCLRQR